MHTWFSLFTAVTRATYFYLTEATRAARFHRIGHFLYTLTLQPLFVTGFAKRGLIHATNFATLMSHNFVCD